MLWRRVWAVLRRDVFGQSSDDRGRSINDSLNDFAMSQVFGDALVPEARGARIQEIVLGSQEESRHFGGYR